MEELLKVGAKKNRHPRPWKGLTGLKKDKITLEW
jgi:hypothetical protein